VINQNSLYCELQQIFYHFSKYHIKIVLEILMQNLGERIFLN